MTDAARPDFHDRIRKLLAQDTREFYLTFGQKYREEPHELGYHWVDPDGWLTVQYTVPEGVKPGDARARAREAAYAYLGGHYAFDYDESNLRHELYPLGELARIVLP